MKAVIVGPAHPFRGGIADTNESLARAMMRAGIDTTLVTFTFQYPDFVFPGSSQFREGEAPEGLKIHRWIHSLNPINWWLAARRINRLKPDMVIIRFWLPLLAPALGSVARLLSKKTIVIGITDNVIPHEKRLMDDAFTRYFVNACDGFMTLSSAVKRDLETLTEKPVRYFPHPINEGLGDRVDQRIARQRLKLNPEGEYALFFGIVRKYKGLDLLLRAMAEAPMAGRATQLIVAGEFYDDIQPYSALIAELGIADRVVLHSGFVKAEEVPYYFSAADVVVQTYRTATQSGITQMALHFDCPSIVTNVGGLSEFVEDGITGLICGLEPSAIAETTSEFFNKYNRASFQPGIEKAKKKFSWDTFTAELVSLHNTLKP